MNVKRDSVPGGGFYLLWLVSGLASILLGWIVSWGLLLLAQAVIGDYIYVNGVRHITEDYLFSWIFFPLIGLLQGAMQALILREVRPRTGMWVLVTPVGWIVAFIFLRGVAEVFFPQGGIPADTLLSRMLIFSTLGLCIGVAQWLVLRRWVDRSWVWILFSMVGWALLPIFTGRSFTSVLELLLIALPPGVVSLLALWLLFDRWQAIPQASTP
ncbi:MULTISPECIES: hypothetical protein [Anaerolinea]|uniref:hypothetical protein n=1 Tax=Anaerolinea TaxID=233189 RepID=UPI002630E313|nr:hypothetical protein [Anaerolinea thermophila]